MKKVFLVLTILLCLNSAVFADTPYSMIYRFYDRNSGEHLFTDTDQYDEWWTLYTTGSWQGWVWEGTAWFSPKIGYGEPVFRLYNPVINDHLYTKDQNEVNVLSQRGWLVDFNGKPAFASGGDIAIYRLYNPGSGRHHLTTDQHEYSALPAYGWQQEGIAFTGLKPGNSNY